MVHNKYIQFAHFNFQSMGTGFDLFLENINSAGLDVIGLSETWLDSCVPDHGLSIPGYKLIRKDRASRGGGVAFYVSDSIKFKIMSVEDSVCGLESLWISTVITGKKLCLGTLYRPPTTRLSNAVDELEDIVSSFLLEHDVLMFGGDLNINLLDMGHLDCIKFKSFLNQFNLFQVITSPTRLASGTLLDVIVCSDAYFIKDSTVLRMDGISDHCLVACEVKFSKMKKPPVFVTYRDYSHFVYNNFLCDLFAIDWDTIFDIEQVDDMIDFFSKNILLLFDKHAPMKTVKSTKTYAPWLTPNLKLMTKLKNKAYVRYKKNPTDLLYKEYKELRNFVSKCVKTEKKSFLNSRFATDPKSFWGSLRKLNISKNSRNDISIDPNTFNNHFANYTSHCSSSASEDINKYDHNFLQHITRKFQFCEVSIQSVDEAFRSIRSQAKGSDGICIKMLSIVFPHLTPYLTHIINVCLKCSTFPASWKDANIIPVSKVCNPQEPTDYRPISILPAMSKVLEKLVYEQIIRYVNEFKLLPQIQSGFRSQHSTTTALLHVTDDILRSCDTGKVTCLVLLDFSKAFDTMDHAILLKKLKYFGFGEQASAFFKHYLENRRQRVKVGTGVSSYLSIHRGVPQGSILGPILFSLYTADFSSLIRYSTVHQYADDTQLYYSFSPSNCFLACTQISDDLETISRIAASHQLILNASKTVVMLFGGQRKSVAEDPNFKIQLNGKKLELANFCKNLGVTIDSELRFNKHVELLVQKAVGKLKLLYLHKDILDPNIRLRLCETLILSQLSYADVLYWPALTRENKYSLQKIQNSCVRFVKGLRKFDHVSGAMRELDWFNLEERFLYHISCLIYKINRNASPVYLYNKLVMRREVHSVNTRHADMLDVPRHRTAMFQRSFTYTAAEVFNNLPLLIKSSSSVFQFRKRIRSYILDCRT